MFMTEYILTSRIDWKKYSGVAHWPKDYSARHDVIWLASFHRTASINLIERKFDEDAVFLFN